TFNKLVERYDVLRTVFLYHVVGRPAQILLKNLHNIVHYEDLTHLDTPTAMETVEQFKKEDRETGFSPTRGPLMRIALFRITANTSQLIWSFHHILMDGWCFGIIFKDFIELYTAQKHGKTITMEPVVPYMRYIQWLEKQDKQQGLDYWANYLEGYEQQASIPKQAKAEPGAYRPQTALLQLDEELTRRLNDLAAAKQVTSNTMFQTYWGILLQKYNNIDDVVFGAIVSGRPPEIEGVAGMVGLFINTVPLRIKRESQNFPQESDSQENVPQDNVSQDNDSTNTFASLINGVQRNYLESRTFEYLPLVEIQAQSYMKNKLIDHIFVFENFPVQENIAAAETKSDVGFEVTGTKMFEQTNYDFNVMAAPSQSGFTIKIMYNAAVYEPPFINRLLKHLETIIQQTVTNPQIEIDTIDIVTNDEKNQLLLDFNDTAAEYPKDKTIHQLFEEQVHRTPDHISLVGSGQSTSSTQSTQSTQSTSSTTSTPSTQAPPLQHPASSIQLTYNELNKKSNRLAALLRTKGVEPDTFVAIMTGRSIEMIIGILGILKAGAAYLPVPHDYPEVRKQLMQKDSGFKILLTTTSLAEEAAFHNEIVTIDQPVPPTATTTGYDKEQPATSLAYAIYTSGSTGKPKGTLTTHQNAVNVTLNPTYVKINKKDRVLQLSNYAFDGSIFDIFGALLNGATLIMMPGNQAAMLENLV
ncbi:MAG: AMP-binding protein, partial [bacterium]|nr:AMP-binding protein [bacterium]